MGQIIPKLRTEAPDATESRSKTSTRLPRFAADQACARPTIPAPTMATVCDGNEALRIICGSLRRRDRIQGLLNILHEMFERRGRQPGDLGGFIPAAQVNGGGIVRRLAERGNLFTGHRAALQFKTVSRRTAQPA